MDKCDACEEGDVPNASRDSCKMCPPVSTISSDKIYNYIARISGKVINF